MRNPNRIEPFLDLLKNAWKKTPEKDLFKLVTDALGDHEPMIFYIEDERYGGLLADYIKEHSDVPVDAKRENEMDDILKELKVLWSRYPDFRFGQLVANFIGEKYPEGKVVGVDDAILNHFRNVNKQAN